ncbi:MAG TPA: rhombosortase [Burkholderiaceae bacterium]|nr:rhombosortase [Burkholderiaceae bacterium]
MIDTRAGARPGWAWAGLAAALALVALAGWPLPHEALDWQPALARTEPWRALSAVGVHYSAMHLLANLAGVLAVGVLGVAARAPAASVWAWAAAWPLTQFGLLVEPALLHYGGLSGVLHAGVAVIALQLLLPAARTTPVRQWIGAALLVGLCLKIAREAPWGPPLRHPAGWDIAVAPLAHASGFAAGAACAIVVQLIGRVRRSAPPASSSGPFT